MKFSRNPFHFFLLLFVVFIFLSIPVSCMARTYKLVEKYWYVGSVLAKQGKYLEAAQKYEKAVVAEQACAEPRLGYLATELNAAASNYFKADKYDQAVKHFQHALEIEKGLERENYISPILFNIGMTYDALGQYSRAAEYYKQALVLSRTSGNEEETLTILNNIGSVYKSLARYDQVIEYYQQALEIKKKLGNAEDIAFLMSKIGSAYESLAKYEQAIEYYQQALEINRKFNIEAGVAVDLNNIGTAYFSLGQSTKALEYLQQALEINKKLGNEENLATFISNIGSVYEALDRYDQAIGHYQQALEIDKRLGREADVAIRLNNIGSVYDSRGQYDQAIKNYQQALEISRKLGREVDAASYLNNLGMAYKSLGHFDKAINYYQQALEIDKRHSESATSKDLSNIGGVYYSWGRYDKAIEYLQQALKIDRKFGRETGIAIGLTNMGGIYKDSGQYDKAIKHFQQAVDLFKKIGGEANIATLLSKIGEVSSSLKQYDKAIELYQQALNIDRRLGREADVALRLNNIGTVYALQGRNNKAIEYFKQALEIVRRLDRKPDIANFLNNLGVAYASLGQNDQAIGYYRQSIQLKEEIRQTAKGDIRRDYLASQISTYQALASAYLQKGDPQGVLDAVEQSRARLLAERIGGIDVKMKVPDLAEVQKGLADNEAVLLFSNINRQKFILMVISGKEIVMKEVSKESFLVKSRKQFKKQLFVLLEKQRGMSIRKKSGKNSKAFAEKKQQADFVTAVHYYRKLLASPAHLEDANKFGQSLYDLLIAPIKDKLAGKTKITIMPDGILGFLPFETFVDEDKNYLAQKYQFRYTQSLTIDKLLENRNYADKKERKAILAMGGALYEPVKSGTQPILGSGQFAALQLETDLITQKKRSARGVYSQLGYAEWTNLPGTLAEVKELSAIIKGSDTLTGDKVTENRIKQYSAQGKLAEYKVIHFATHGLVVPELPELSAIVLSQFKNEKDNEDGYLRMGEIAKLDIAADFVNLSACETGLGRIYNGEGVVGLTQSFLIAGANGLSVSLWQVADDSTARFMSELYKKVENENLDYNRALTEIKREFINGDYGEKWQNPYYWSPFVYYGK